MINPDPFHYCLATNDLPVLHFWLGLICDALFCVATYPALPYFIESCRLGLASGLDSPRFLIFLFRFKHFAYTGRISLFHPQRSSPKTPIKSV